MPEIDQTSDRWIECECPTTGEDFDLSEIAGPDSIMRCAACSGSHRLGDIGQMLQTNAAGDVSRVPESEWRTITLPPIEGRRLHTLGNPSSDSERVIAREASRCAKEQAPFAAHGREWLITRIDDIDGVLIIEGTAWQQVTLPSSA